MKRNKASNKKIRHANPTRKARFAASEQKRDSAKVSNR